MTTGVLRADALTLPIADASVDLIVSSPPYFALRSYQDDGAHYGGQIGSEPTPDDFLRALWAVTRECWRVLKPSGSLFVNLGDKYAGSGGHNNAGISDKSTLSGNGHVGGGPKLKATRRSAPDSYNKASGRARPKSLMGLPWRFAIGCIDGAADPDGVGWILRAEVVWSKPNGLPESVTDRVRRSHEQWFHFTKAGRYYSAIDELREAHAMAAYEAQRADVPGVPNRGGYETFTGGTLGMLAQNPLGKLPGSVWTIATEPLIVPASLDVDHFAAFPTEWPRRLIVGWSPREICTACNEGRRPVVDKTERIGVTTRPETSGTRAAGIGITGTGYEKPGADTWNQTVAKILGCSCRCTPFVDHERTTPRGVSGETHAALVAKGEYITLGNRPHADGGREYLLDGWTPPPSRPAVVLDPFGGTGTVAMVAQALGRVGISVDLSADYCRLAQWRINESDHDLKAVARTEGVAVAESTRDRRDKRRAGYVEMFPEERAANA